MTRTCLAVCTLVLGISSGMAVPTHAADRDRYPEPPPRSERYVPASGDLIEFLFGGPRYYDRQMTTTAAGACAYHPVGPDANAVNDINDHYCGK